MNRDRDSHDANDSTDESDAVLRDLPEMSDNTEVFVTGFYTGFVGWSLRGSAPESGEDGWYYVGHILGWLSKALLIVWLAQTVLPPVDTFVRPAAMVGSAAGVAVLAKAALGATLNTLL